MTKHADTRAGQKPAVLGGAYALCPRPTHRLAVVAVGFAGWEEKPVRQGLRAVRRPRDFWYSSMSAGAAPLSGHARSSQAELNELQEARR
jgi:hypothetical protein